MPIKDIIVSGYNRLGRKITGDENYTPIKGRVYTNEDFNKGFNDISNELLEKNQKDKAISA